MENYHGTVNGYVNKGCRCVLCKTEMREYMKPQRDESGRTQTLRGRVMPLEDHGTITGYAKWSCRCFPCREAWSEVTGTTQWGRVRQLKSAHGTPSRYNNQRCRCVECRKAWADYLRPDRDESGRTKTLRGKQMPHSVHGTDYGYKRWGCRCVECTEMHKLYQAEYRRLNPGV